MIKQFDGHVSVFDFTVNSNMKWSDVATIFLIFIAIFCKIKMCQVAIFILIAASISDWRKVDHYLTLR